MNSVFRHIPQFILLTKFTFLAGSETHDRSSFVVSKAYNDEGITGATDVMANKNIMYLKSFETFKKEFEMLTTKKVKEEDKKDIKDNLTELLSDVNRLENQVDVFLQTTSKFGEIYIVDQSEGLCSCKAYIDFVETMKAVDSTQSSVTRLKKEIEDCPLFKS